MRKKIILIVIVFLLSVAGVTGAVLLRAQFGQGDGADSTGSTKQGVQAVVNAHNTFAFDLYADLAKAQTDNIFYSPYSIATALSLAQEGARGQTAKEMQAVLHTPDADVLRPNSAAIYNNLHTKTTDYELKTGNALWLQQAFLLREPYVDSAKKYYASRVQSLDFAGAPDAARETINAYIANQTNNKIKDVLPTGSINSATKLVLTNAIYFKGSWRYAFDAANTTDDTFFVGGGDSKTVPMMHMASITTNYAYTQDLQILELPYKGDALSMLILLPTGDLTSLESGLTAAKLSQYKAQMRQTEIDAIAIPKFELDTVYSMRETLRALGMPTAFSGGADFSGMTDRGNLSISSVNHKAYVKVDERGTEAAAATTVNPITTSVTDAKPMFIANRPFIFLIQEKATGHILFMGRVASPS